MMATSELPPRCGGIGWYVHYLTAELRRRGIAVTPVIRTAPDGGAGATDGPLRVEASNLPWFGPRRFSRGLRALPGTAEHDLAVVHGAHLGGWALDIPVLQVNHWCQAEGNIRFRLGSRHLPDAIRVLLHPLLRRAEGRSMSRATTVGAVSRAMVGEIGRHHGLEAVYLGNGVDTSRFAPAEEVSRPPRGVLFVSMFKHGKGLRHILDIVRRVRRAGCDIPFTLVGRGPMERWLRSRIASSGLVGVAIRPYVDHVDLPAVYREHSMLLLPSFYEGLPTVVLEAMASGLPVVATDAGGTGEATVDGETGACVPVGDVARMAEAILRFDADPALARRLGRAGREKCLVEFSWPAIAGHYLEAFEVMLGRVGDGPAVLTP